MANALGLTGAGYASVAAENLLDADTAHCHQSLGYWQSDADAGGVNHAQSTALTPIFGDYHGVVECEGSLQTILRTAGGGSFASHAVPVTAGETYTASVYLATDTADREVEVYIQFYNSVPSLVNSASAGSGQYQAVLVDEWTQYSVTAVAGTGAVYARIYIYFRKTDDSTADAGDKVYFDAGCIRQGSNGTFIPSLNIVGSLEWEAKHMNPDWANGSLQYFFHRQDAGAFEGYAGAILSADTRISVSHGDGANLRAESSAVSEYTMVDGDTAIIKVSFDNDTGDVTYYQDGVEVGTDTFTPAAGAPGIPGAFL